MKMEEMRKVDGQRRKQIMDERGKSGSRERK